MRKTIIWGVFIITLMISASLFTNNVQAVVREEIKEKIATKTAAIKKNLNLGRATIGSGTLSAGSKWSYYR